MRIEYDEEKGIINEETKEVIISLDKIIKDDDEDDFDDKDDENDMDDDKIEEEDKKEKINENEKNEEEEKSQNINGKECEDIDTSSKPEE